MKNEMVRSIGFILVATMLLPPAAANPSSDAIKPVAPLKVGDQAPLLLGLRADGDAAAVRPWQWDGRYTLLVFWSPENLASLRQLEQLRRLLREFGADERFRIVSVATAVPPIDLERNYWDTWITFIGQQSDLVGTERERLLLFANSDWEQLFEAELFDPANFPADARGLTSSGRYGVTNLPEEFLIGPDGRLRAVRIASNQLHSTVAAFLSKVVETPTPHGMQELFDLSVRRTKLLLELQFVERRLTELEREQFASFERVADPLGSHYSENESDMVYEAKATHDISAEELLLYHAPGIYRAKDVRPKLTTNGECWYFRPDRHIRKGQTFTIVLVYDAPEELELKANGRFPLTSRARDPEHPYNTRIEIHNRQDER